MKDNIGIVLRTEAGLDELEVMMHGTATECEAYLFGKLMPSDFTRNLQRLESNDGYLFSVERMREGLWKEYKYLLLFSAAREDN